MKTFKITPIYKKYNGKDLVNNHTEIIENFQRFIKFELDVDTKFDGHHKGKLLFSYKLDKNCKPVIASYRNKVIGENTIPLEVKLDVIIHDTKLSILFENRGSKQQIFITYDKEYKSDEIISKLMPIIEFAMLINERDRKEKDLVNELRGGIMGICDGGSLKQVGGMVAFFSASQAGIGISWFDGKLENKQYAGDGIKVILTPDISQYTVSIGNSLITKGSITFVMENLEVMNKKLEFIELAMADIMHDLKVAIGNRIQAQINIEPKFEINTKVEYINGGPTIHVGEIVDIRIREYGTIEYLIVSGESGLCRDWRAEEQIKSKID